MSGVLVNPQAPCGLLSPYLFPSRGIHHYICIVYYVRAESYHYTVFVLFGFMPV